MQTLKRGIILLTRYRVCERQDGKFFVERYERYTFLCFILWSRWCGLGNITYPNDNYTFKLNSFYSYKDAQEYIKKVRQEECEYFTPVNKEIKMKTNYENKL